jgi:NADPH2:quinone reductase
MALRRHLRQGLPLRACARQLSASAAVPETMRALVVHDTGGAEQLKLESAYPVPALVDGQVLVANQYSGVNFIDTYHRGGLYPRELPFICGQEGAGVVAATTPAAEAQGIALGDRVAYSVLGAYCEYTAVPAAKILQVPDGVGLDVANACLTQGLTAHYLTHECHAGLVKEGEWMLIHGVGSGACQWAAQIAKIKGYKVIGTTSTSKADIGQATGVDELIVLDEAPGTSYEDYTSQDIVAQVMEMTGGAGAKCVIDGIGLATYEISLDCLARRGVFISNASGAVPAYPPLRHIAKSSFMTRPKLLDYTVDREELLYRANDIFGWIADGSLRVTIDKTFPLADGPAAHEYLEAGLSRGKLVYEL